MAKTREEVVREEQSEKGYLIPSRVTHVRPKHQQKWEQRSLDDQEILLSYPLGLIVDHFASHRTHNADCRWHDQSLWRQHCRFLHKFNLPHGRSHLLLWRALGLGLGYVHSLWLCPLYVPKENYKKLQRFGHWAHNYQRLRHWILLVR